MVGTLQGNHEDLGSCSKDKLLHHLEALAGMLLRNPTLAIHILLLGSNGVSQGHRTFQHAFPDSYYRH